MMHGLKAERMAITLGAMRDFERVIGTDRMNVLITEQKVDVTFEERVAIMQILGYTADEAESLEVDQMEAEISFFFARYAEASLRGRLHSQAILHSALNSKKNGRHLHASSNQTQ